MFIWIWTTEQLLVFHFHLKNRSFKVHFSILIIIRESLSIHVQTSPLGIHLHGYLVLSLSWALIPSWWILVLFSGPRVASWRPWLGFLSSRGCRCVWMYSLVKKTQGDPIKLSYSDEESMTFLIVKWIYVLKTPSPQEIVGTGKESKNESLCLHLIKIIFKFKEENGV